MNNNQSSNWKQWWAQFLISVLGTAIGVGLTFAVSKKVENNKMEQAQRLTAMMVIVDMEQSLETICRIKADEEQRYQAALYVQNHLSEIDSISYDTLSLIANYIMDGSYVNTDLEFSESGEKVFQSAQDAWMNLNDISFIRSVDEFYKSRSVFKHVIQNHYTWQKPVSKAENDEMLTGSDILDSWKKYNLYLKSKLEEPKARKYISHHSNRMDIYNSMIEQWSECIAYCKTLMHITDEEMKEFKE